MLRVSSTGPARAARQNDPEWREFYERLGARIRELREAAGLSQRDVAEAVLGSRTLQSTVSRWENALWVPQIANLQKLAEFFGVSPADLGVHDTEILSRLESDRVRVHVTAALVKLQNLRSPALKPVRQELEQALDLLPA